MEKPINVVHLINALPSIGGAERLVLDIALYAPARPTTVITWHSPDISLLDHDSTGVLDVIALNPWSLQNWERARAAYAAADIVHVHLFPSQYIGSLLRKPTVFTEHNTWNRRRDVPLFKPLERWSYRSFDAVAAISEDAKNALADWLGEEPSLFRTIPNGVRISRFFGQERFCPAPGRTAILGMAARFCETKDFRTLFEAMALLPANYVLELAGVGETEQQLRLMVADLDITDRVIFRGLVKNMPGFYNGINAYIQSSLHDGFALSAAEAMASGLPTFGSDIPGLRCTIGRADQLFEQGNPQDLADKVQSTLEDPDAYRAASLYALEHSREFDVSLTAAGYYSLYHDVLAARQTSRQNSKDNPSSFAQPMQTAGMNAHTTE